MTFCTASESSASKSFLPASKFKTLARSFSLLRLALCAWLFALALCPWPLALALRPLPFALGHWPLALCAWLFALGLWPFALRPLRLALRADLTLASAGKPRQEFYRWPVLPTGNSLSL